MSQLNFDMDALRTLVAGVDLAGFSHAATRVNRSASAVSMQLRKLEKQAGQRLFSRRGRNLVLNDAGELLLGYARRMLALNDEAAAALGAVTAAGTVRVGMPQDFADLILPSLLARFSKEKPLTHLEVRAGRNYALADEVAKGKLDLALAFSAPGSTQALRIATLPAVWVGLPKYSVKNAMNGVVPLVAFDGPCFFRKAATAALDGAGLPWRFAMSTPSLASLWTGVSTGLGITVRASVGLPSGLAILRSGSGLPALGSVDLVLHGEKDLSQAALLFKEMLLESLARECGLGIRHGKAPKKA